MREDVELDGEAKEPGGTSNRGDVRTTMLCYLYRALVNVTGVGGGQIGAGALHTMYARILRHASLASSSGDVLTLWW